MVGDADELGRGVDVRDEVDARRTRTKMTMRINDLIRITILALSAMPAEARLWFRFWAWARERAALAARKGGSGAWRTVTAGGTTRGCDGASGGGSTW